MRLQATYLQVNEKKETLATRKLRPMLAAVVCDSKYAAGMHRYSLSKQRYKCEKVLDPGLFASLIRSVNSISEP
jgi:hypothetical protein